MPLLQPGQTFIAQGMQSLGVVKSLLGEGGQAEVYRARIGDTDYALKWYLPHYLSADRRLWGRLKEAVSRGFPTEKFLWPFDLATLPRSSVYSGYLMPIAEPPFVSLVDLVTRQAEPSFRSLTTMGFHLAHGFLKLHSSGLCYRDINFGNIFFDPANGDVRIGDTDNVDVDRMPGGIMGTPGFMAPEVGRREVEPNSMSDRFSLAVLLFYIFMLNHPLKGRREMELSFDASDRDGSRRLFIDEPVFIFDPDNASNRPVPGVHEPAINFWPIYPKSFRDFFIQVFTRGLRDPEGRVMDNDWRKEMCRLRDAIFLCPCGAELFFDLEHYKLSRSLAPCWSCQKIPAMPPRMRISQGNDASLFMLTPGTQLFPHHLEGDAYNFFAPMAEVVDNPLGLKNLSRKSWSARVDGALKEIPPNSILYLAQDTTIHFGRTEAQTKLN
jgi:eukaryotic-like serine/threonine-protein kinase